MWTFSREFSLPQWPGRMFRVRSRSPDWRADVPSRMAVLEAMGTGNFAGCWADFVTVRELEIEPIAEALEALGCAP